jgi:nitroimidazol reductase NimA-like FMN-containing flavoprotein (pyridoxamine 5'-phosphate oxidase superfamily)
MGPDKKPINEPRRRDRTQDDAWIGAFLTVAPFGFLATVDGDQPFLNSNLFAYAPAEGAIYLHTHRTGRTRHNLSDPAKVAFSVADMGRLLPADEALEFSVEYASVVVFGWGRVVGEPAEAERGLQLILDKYAPHLRPGRDYRPITQQELRRTAVFRIDVESWSGKNKEVQPDFPGAYRYRDPELFPEG